MHTAGQEIFNFSMRRALAGRPSPLLFSWLSGSGAGGRKRIHLLLALPAVARSLTRMAAEARREREREIWKKKQLYGLQQRQTLREADGRACGQTNDRVMASMLDATLSFVDFRANSALMPFAT